MTIHIKTFAVTLMLAAVTTGCINESEEDDSSGAQSSVVDSSGSSVSSASHSTVSPPASVPSASSSPDSYSSDGSTSWSNTSAVPCGMWSNGTELEAPSVPRHSEESNTAPIVDFAIDMYGKTVYVDAIKAWDAESDALDITINFNDDFEPSSGLALESIVRSDSAWHTYQEPGEYSITVTADDGYIEKSLTKTVTLVDEFPEINNPPLALIRAQSVENTISIRNYSFDLDGDALTYEWTAESYECGRWSANGENPGRLAGPDGWVNITLTVFDGDLGDTVTVRAELSEYIVDIGGTPRVFLESDGDTVFGSVRGTFHYSSVAWDFGDGTTSSDPEVRHTYDAPGEYEVTAFVSAHLVSDTIKKTIVVPE